MRMRYRVLPASHVMPRWIVALLYLCHAERWLIMQIEKEQDIAIIKIKGSFRQRAQELRRHLSELITNNKPKIVLDIREAELNMSYRDLFKDIVATANRSAQQKKGVVVFLASPGRKINLRIPDGLDIEKFYMEEQAIEFLQKQCK